MSLTYLPNKFEYHLNCFIMILNFFSHCFWFFQFGYLCPHCGERHSSHRWAIVHSDGPGIFHPESLSVSTPDVSLQLPTVWGCDLLYHRNIGKLRSWQEGSSLVFLVLFRLFEFLVAYCSSSVDFKIILQTIKHSGFG